MATTKIDITDIPSFRGQIAHLITGPENPAQLPMTVQVSRESFEVIKEDLMLTEGRWRSRLYSCFVEVVD